MKYIYTLVIILLSAFQFAHASKLLNSPLPELPTYFDTEQLSAEQVIHKTFNSDLYASSQGSTHEVYWHKLTFSPGEFKEHTVIHLHLLYNVIEQLDFYLFENERLIQDWQRGALQNWNNKSAHGDANGIWIPIALSDKNTITLLIRKQGEHQLLTPITLFDNAGAYDASHKEVFFWVMTITGMLLLLAHNLVVFILLRNPGFGFYLALNVLIFLSVSSVLGFSRWIFNEPISQFLVANLFGLFALAAWSLYRFSLSFLAEVNIPATDSLIKRHGDWLFAGYFIATFYLHTQTAGLIFAVLEVSLFLCCFYWGIKSYRNGFTAARFYLFSWLMLMVGSVLNTCIYWQIIPVNLFTQGILPVASIIQLLGISLAFVDKARFIEQSRKLQLHMDASTQTPNRLYCLEQLGQLLANRYDQALVIIDITSYAKLSQAFGPAKADKVMCDLISRIHMQLIQMENILPLPLANKRTAFIMRLSSTRIAFVSTASSELASQIDHIKTVLDLSTNIDKVFIRNQYNIGSAVYPVQGNTIDKLFQNALIACDLADTLDSHWRTFSPELKSVHARQLNMISLLTEDIEQKRLHFDIQPQVNLNDQSIVGGEFLVRWNNSQLGLISPGEFIPLAEKTGLINKLTCFVIDEAFRWVSAHANSLKGCRLSINISALDLLQDNFAKNVIAKAALHSIDTRYITLEITETTIFDDNPCVKNNVKTLQAEGFSLSIDDFGSGYSSLQNLIHLQAKELKVDRFFVDKITTDAQSATLCRSMISLSQDLNLISVAEGIEQPEEVALLKQWQCEVGQGFLFYRPLAPVQFLALIA